MAMARGNRCAWPELVLALRICCQPHSLERDQIVKENQPPSANTSFALLILVGLHLLQITMLGCLWGCKRKLGEKDDFLDNEKGSDVLSRLSLGVSCYVACRPLLFCCKKLATR